MTLVERPAIAFPEDLPKSLASELERARRRAMRESPHVKPFSALIDEIRDAMTVRECVPDVDPLDGGVYARMLFILEAPGSQAIRTGFVSRNNPDETAKNFFLLNREAGLAREQTAIWNVVPWYVGRTTEDAQPFSKIRPVNERDLSEALPWLKRFVLLFPRLDMLVLMGRKAQRVRGELAMMRPDVSIVSLPHPSPVFINRRPDNRARLLSELRAVSVSLDS